MRNKKSILPIFVICGFIVIGLLLMFYNSDGSEKSGLLKGLERVSGISE